MRLAAAGCLLVGCLWQPHRGDDVAEPPPDNTGWGSGWGGTGGSSGYRCWADSDCPAPAVCARDGQCTSLSSVRIVHVTWTLRGQPATSTTCTNVPQLDITFSDYELQFGFSPVPCSAGKFTVDKLPVNYTAVQLARTGDGFGGGLATFDAAGNAAVDLLY